MISQQLDFYDMHPDVTAFSSTRHGGYSHGNYAAFNINHYCGDDPTAISRNREALCSLLDIDAAHLVLPHQVHQTRVARVDASLPGLSPAERQQSLEGADAVMTAVPGLCIGVSTADCIPLLVYDPRQHAACAIHAGWRGTVQRIVGAALSAMAAAYGSRPADLLVQIGPGISRDSFEVGDEVYEAFREAGFCMAAISERRSKWHIDLPACNRLQLLEAGVTEQHVRLSPVCTFKQADSYFSARRLGINSGRIFTGILMK